LSTLEAEFRAFLEDTLALSLDEFLSGLSLPDNVAERLGNMSREEIDEMLGSLSPAARAGLLSFSRHVLDSAGVRLRKSTDDQWRTSELWDWEGVLSTKPNWWS
jgi:hypothetical protein